MTCFKPSNWLYGLVAVAVVAFIVIAGEGPRIEQDLTARSKAALDEEGYSWAKVTFNGRDGVLTGTAFDSRERSEALKVASDVRGVGSMQDRAKLLPVVSPYTWWIIRSDDQLRIKGHVPTAADQKTILGIVKATMPDLDIDDRTKFAAGNPPKQNWLGAVSFALNQLSHLDTGTIRLTGMEMHVAGRAANQASFAAILKALSSPLPSELKLSHQEISPPKAVPYKLAIEYSGNMVKISGHVPNESMRKELVDKIGRDLTGVLIDDTMMLGSGIPKDWGDATVVALAVLSRLEFGNINIVNKDLTIEGMVADAATAAEISKLIRESLPAQYKPVEKIEVRKSEG